MIYRITLAFLLLSFIGSTQRKIKYAVIVAANMEWNAVKRLYPYENYNPPFGVNTFKKKSAASPSFSFTRAGEKCSGRWNAIRDRPV